MSSSPTTEDSRILSIIKLHEEWFKTQLLSTFQNTIEQFYLKMAISRTSKLINRGSNPTFNAMLYWTTPEQTTEGEMETLSQGETHLLSDLRCILAGKDGDEEKQKYPLTIWILGVDEPWLVIFVVLDCCRKGGDDSDFRLQLDETVGQKPVSNQLAIEKFVETLEKKLDVRKL